MKIFQGIEKAPPAVMQRKKHIPASAAGVLAAAKPFFHKIAKQFCLL
jgi:hypothetical protein